MGAISYSSRFGIYGKLSLPLLAEERRKEGKNRVRMEMMDRAKVE